jgi:NADPH-dependent glutamate synthase beta subunit-like oxidoreductase
VPVVKKVRKLGAGGGGDVGGRATSALRPQAVLKMPPCATGCPNATDVRAVLTTIAQAESRGTSQAQAFTEAFALIAERNPLPAVTGRVCPHPCEAACNRTHLDGAAAFNAVERFVGDFALEHGLPLPRSGERHPERIAVVGAGPAGLSCAYQLARRGYAVTVFEAFPRPGGMLRYGIPTYRLPRAVLDAEIARIVELGVELRCDTAAGRDVAHDDLRAQYQAVFVGVGAHRGLRLGVPGEAAAGVLSGVEFLHRVNGGQAVSLGSQVVVVGGGDTAIDAARVARRLGAAVTILYRRTLAEMPAIREEIEEAQREGVRIEFLVAPAAVIAAEGRATGLTCRRMELGEPDASGRRRPVPVAGSEFDVPASAIIAAISQESDLQGLTALAVDGRVRVDGAGETAVSGTFAGGDMVDLGLVTTAIFHGRRAAETIHRRLRGLTVAADAPAPAIGRDRIRLDYYPRVPRATTSSVAVAERFVEPDREVNLPLTGEQVVGEARRCMSCGLCFACDSCWKYCQEQAVVRPAVKGEAYRFKLDFCVGCKKCAEECPCGYIEMV